MIAWLSLSLIGLLICNIPIAISLGLACYAALAFGGTNIPLSVVPQRMFTAVDSFPFLAIPFFMLAGSLMENGGISRRLVNLAKTVVGFLPGGLGVITVLACAFFGALSGSNAATVAAIGSIMIPAMVKEGYPRDLACAISASAGTLGVVVPPSVPMITYGVISGVSIGALFMAGVFPAVIMVLSLVGVMMAFSGKWKLKREKVSFREFGRSFADAILALLMPVIILGGIYGGVFTPTEAAAVAVVYSLLVSVVIYREIKVGQLKGIILGAGLNTAIVMFVISTSSGFSWLVTSLRIPVVVASAIMQVSSDPAVVLFLVNVLLLILGIVLETNAIILLVTPILLPLTTQVGIDPLLLGLIMVVNTSVGMITPPMAVNIFVASSIGGQSIEAISRRIGPFLAVLIVDIFIISYIPGLAMWLPRRLGM